MGYTHYFTARRHLTDKEWSDLRADFMDVVTAAQAQGIGLEVQNLPRQLRLNGATDDEQHEPFILVPDQAGFEFCKTARKPYDTPVVAMLCLLAHRAPGAYDIGSDGHDEDWQDGLRLAQRVAPAATLPPREE